MVMSWHLLQWQWIRALFHQRIKVMVRSKIRVWVRCSVWSMVKVRNSVGGRNQPRSNYRRTFGSYKITMPHWFYWNIWETIDNKIQTLILCKFKCMTCTCHLNVNVRFKVPMAWDTTLTLQSWSQQTNLVLSSSKMTYISSPHSLKCHYKEKRHVLKSTTCRT